MATSAKQQALQDIKEELKREGKSFIGFRSELNPVMRELVKSHILMMTKAKKGGHHGI